MSTAQPIYYTVYQTTNLLNNRYYIGVHMTTNPHDSYLGSGIALQRAIERYGRENFTKQILFQAFTYDDMYAMEKVFVNEDIVQDHKSYNLRDGGYGGWYINGVNPSQTEHGRERVRASWTQERRQQARERWKGHQFSVQIIQRTCPHCQTYFNNIKVTDYAVHVRKCSGKQTRTAQKVEIDNICFLSMQEAAQFFQCNKNTIRNWLQSGKHNAKKLREA